MPDIIQDYKHRGDLFACPCDESKMYDRFLMPVKSKGMWVWFEGETDPYLDLVLNYCSVNFGHSYPPIVEIVKKAAERGEQIHSFHSKDKLELSEYLAKKAGEDKKYKVYFNVGGSAAVSDAIRLCRFATGNRYMISFSGAFHGVSDAAAAVTDDRLVAKAQYGIPMADYTFFVPFPGTHTNISVTQCISKIEGLISTYDIAGVIVEPIQGAAGFIFPKDSFLPKLSALCTKHNVNLIMDEIQAGFGRAGSFFAFQYYGVKEPDIVLLSKSIAGGYFPVSAVIARADFFDPVPSRGTAFQTTFNNSFMGLYIANQVIKLVQTQRLFDNILEKGEVFLEKLQFLTQSPYVKNLRGLGFAMAFDIMDPLTGAASDKLAKQFVSQCLEQNVIVYACGVDFNTIKLIPSLLATDQEIDFISDSLKTCLTKFQDMVN
jgi:4-aminobutyrate aminotransferase-like enzyme